MKPLIKRFSRKSIIWSAIILVILIALSFWIFNKNGNGDEKTLTVRRGEFIKEVSVSGKVVPTESVDLSFSETGRVASLNVAVGDKVSRGQILASLPTGTLQSDLLAARAALAQKKSEGQNTLSNFEQVKEEQDTLVANAYGNLLSEGLAAVPSSSNTTATPPTVTGRYQGSEGRYKIVIRAGGQSNSNSQLSVFNLESVGPVEIEDDEPTPLGTRGLFISFPDDIDDYADTIWYITIPNTKSSSYLANFNEYQEALQTREREIAEAGADLVEDDDGLAIAEAEIQSAEAEVARVQAAIAERIIYAPFSGTITKVDAKLGGVASANEPAISLISADNLQIESFIPEIHVPFIKIGDEAKVALDAYGPDVPFVAKVVFLDPAETVRDGVSTYRAKLEFLESDARVKSGMTANVVIITEKKSDVIVVPQGAVTTRDWQKFVSVKTDSDGNATEERLVTVGNVSSFGEIEITSGLKDGETIILPAPESN